MSSSRTKKTTSIAIDSDLHRVYRKFVDDQGISMLAMNNAIIAAVVEGKIPIRVEIEVGGTKCEPIQIHRGVKAA